MANTKLPDACEPRRWQHLLDQTNNAIMQISRPKNVAPSRRAAITIIAPRTWPATSGWRAMLSSAEAPILPKPKPAPMIANPTPNDAVALFVRNVLVGAFCANDGAAHSSMSTTTVANRRNAFMSLVTPVRGTRTEILHLFNNRNQCSGCTAMPRNIEVKNVNTYACRKAMNNSKKLNAVTDS